MQKLRLVIREAPFLNDVCGENHLPDEIVRNPKVDVLRLSVVPAERDHEIWKLIVGSDLVISKGMANFENYSEESGFYFLLIAKCDVVSQLIGDRTQSPVKIGDWIFMQNNNSTLLR